jgi:hypothetical protein
VLISLAGCGSSHPVVVWGGAASGINERIVIGSSGESNYAIINDGVSDEPERLVLSRSQVSELGDMLRGHDACKLAHDPAYQPSADEGQTTLQLSFDDLKCSVTLYDLEWQRDAAREITETMLSFRPHHKPGEKNKSRPLNPRESTGREH